MELLTNQIQSIAIKSAVDDAFLSDSRPTGKWLTYKGGFYCSYCGNQLSYSDEYDSTDYKYLYIHHEYCSCCGAHMKKEDNDEY